MSNIIEKYGIVVFVNVDEDYCFVFPDENVNRESDGLDVVDTVGFDISENQKIKYSWNPEKTEQNGIVRQVFRN